MLIHTKDYDFVTVNDEDIIDFPEGVYAFENSKKFVVLNTNSKAGIMQLQCAQEQTPRFIILDPFIFLEDYAPIVPADAMKKLKAASIDDVSIFVIAVIPENISAATVNLKSPVIINFKERLGMQVMLENADYPLRFRLFDQERAG